MTRCPLAVWDPLGKQTEPRMTSHDIVCLHTMAGRFSTVDSMYHANGYGGTESHFGVRADGFVKQWQDLDFQADANNEGNPRVISIETEDTGAPFPSWAGSDVPAWTPAQLDAIVPLVRWLCDHYQIPKRLIPDTRPGRRGIGYHRQGIPGNFPEPYTGLVPGGELWTVLPGGRGKPCPGDRRITQTIGILIPRVNGDDFMSALTEAEQRELLARVRVIAGEDPVEDSDIAGGDVRASFKTLIQGSVLDGLREKTDDHPDRGVLRGELFDILDAWWAAKVEAPPSVPPAG